MSNGSVLVVGGERGSNDIAEPTLEVLPKPDGGPTYLFMDWLNRTDPNNLYPFLHMLPSGNIFAGKCQLETVHWHLLTPVTGYYNEARILNPHTFETVKELPNMPGSVQSQFESLSLPTKGGPYYRVL